MIVSAIVAASTNDVIGHAGKLPWHLPEDLRRFRRLTYGHAIVMGRVTHESIIAERGAPLNGRVSVVVTSGRQEIDEKDILFAPTPEIAVSIAEDVERAHGGKEIFIAGGASIYRQTMHLARRVYLTRVHRAIDGDRAMPTGWLDGFSPYSREHCSGGRQCPDYSFLEYRREPW